MPDTDLHPMLIQGLVVVPGPERLEVVGGARTQVFTGRFATETLPRLLALLDGGRTVAGVATELGVAPEDLAPVVDLLVTRGVVTRSAPPTSAMDAFLTRSLGTGRARTVGDRLARSTVDIVGTGEHTERLAELLHRSGVGTTGAAPADLTVCFDDAPPPAGPVLLVRLTATAVAVGPLCRTPGGRCPDCLPPATATAPGTPDGATLATGLALVAGAVLRYLGRFGAPEELRGITTVACHGLDHQVTEVARQPNCRTCGWREPVPPAVEFARAQAGEQPPWGDQVEPNPGIGPSPRKRYLAAHVLHPRDGGSLVRRLGWLLSRTVGTRPGGDVGRWAPSVGNLHSTHAYVAGDLDGTGSRLYYVEPARSVLVPLRRTANLPGTATVVLTGDVAAARPYFGAGADHVVLQDAGFVLGQLHGLAAAAGLRVEDRARAGELTALLSIDPTREIPVAAVTVTPDPDGSSVRMPRHRPAGYRFSDRAVPAAALRALLRTAGELGRPAGVGCGIYVRGAGLPGTTYRPEPIEEFLAERALEVPVLLLFHGDPAEVLARFGPDGHTGSVVTAASAANRVRLAAARYGLSGGLFARLPASLLAAASGDWTLPPRVLAGLALGYPARPAHRTSGVEW